MKIIIKKQKTLARNAKMAHEIMQLKIEILHRPVKKRKWWYFNQPLLQCM
jgi:hypothetical protein